MLKHVKRAYSAAVAATLLGAAGLVSSSPAALAACVGPGAPDNAQTKCVTAIKIPGNPLTSFDISWTNPDRAEYYLADRSNSGIDIIDTQTLWDLPNGRWVATGGLVITRQRPGSASGVTFVTLEDEVGYVNLIVWKRVADEQRAALLDSRLLEVRGRIQREGDVLHVIARRLIDRSAMLGDLMVESRNFR